MTNIFEGEHSIYHSGTTDILEVLERISSKYMADHPWQCFGLRPFIDCGFETDEESFYTFDFDNVFPDAKMGSYCYAMAFVESKTDTVLAIHIDARCNTELYINGELVEKTGVFSEAIPQKKKIIQSFKKGRNVVFLKVRKNAIGFTTRFGEGLIGNNPICFRTPFVENEGALGWLYTRPFEEDIYKNPEDFPSIDDNQSDFWLPSYNNNEKNIFGKDMGYIYACSTLFNNSFSKEIEFSCNLKEEYTIYLDGEKIASASGKNKFSSKATPGFHYVAIEIKYDGEELSHLEIEAFSGGKSINFVPFKFVRSNTTWLTMGVLREKNKALTKALDINMLGETKNGYTYYRAGFTNKFMRVVREDAVYGAWTYPLGVVMYGLYETARTLNSEKISSYASEHILASTKIHKYATWDKQVHNYPSLNGNVVSLDMLDFCGSFGNAILAGCEFCNDSETMFDVVHYIADYIKNKQERLENGMFFRIRPGTIHDNTIWADDLYMSVPFLCRYYTLTGEKEYLEDAVNQILCFKDYLYMPEKKLMSHVYNLTYGKNTQLPWGRGNGWTLFSFTELLMVLPENHPKRDELIAFFKDLCDGVLAHQDKYGMWHQLVNDPESYRETSCTAMFTCTFARGVRNGWLDKRFADAALKGWDGLCNHAVDSKGNVYGVCVASQYSFRPEYYKDELLWHTNDLHGIGIVMLAGVEVNKLIESL